MSGRGLEAASRKSCDERREYAFGDCNFLDAFPRRSPTPFARANRERKSFVPRALLRVIYEATAKSRWIVARETIMVAREGRNVWKGLGLTLQRVSHLSLPLYYSARSMSSRLLVWPCLKGCARSQRANRGRGSERQSTRRNTGTGKSGRTSLTRRFDQLGIR